MLKRSNLLSACFCAFFALAFIVTGCSKKDSTPAYSGPPTITGINSTVFHAGDTVHVSGKGLTTAAYSIELFDSLYVNVLQATDTSVVFILPSASHFGYYGGASGELWVDNPAASEKFTITVIVPEPHGWFTPATMNYLKAVGYPEATIHIYFPGDSVGYLQHNNGILKSTDGGDTWQSPGSLAYGAPYGLAVLDSNNVWSYGFPVVVSTTNGGNAWSDEPLPTALNGAFITGMSMSGPATGFMMTQNGNFYSLAGSWDTTSATGILKEYQTTSPAGNVVFSAMSALDPGDLLAGGIVHPNSTTYSNDVVVKTNGVYDEYLLPSAVSQSGFITMQLLNPTMGYALDGYYHILKYTGSRNWALLGSQNATALYFTDANNGYSSYGQQIAQTTDGGQSWTPVYNLKPNQMLYNFTAHNGHIWGVGMDTAAGKGFVVKYNP